MIKVISDYFWDKQFTISLNGDHVMENGQNNQKQNSKLHFVFIFHKLVSPTKNWCERDDNSLPCSFKPKSINCDHPGFQGIRWMYGHACHDAAWFPCHNVTNTLIFSIYLEVITCYFYYYSCKSNEDEPTDARYWWKLKINVLRCL